MGDMTREQLEAAVESNFDEVADQVFDVTLEGQLEKANDPASFRVTTARLKASSNLASEALPNNLRLAAFAGAGDWGREASEGSGTISAVNTERVVEEADDEKRKSAAEAIRDYICKKLRTWFDENFQKIKEWVETLGIKGALKKMVGIAKQLTVAAVTAIAGVVGSMFLAYLLIGVAVAAVGAAIYFLVRKGLPDYCPA